MVHLGAETARAITRIAAIVLFFAAASVNAEEVDLELVLAMDASGSISEAEYILQLEGTSSAFRDPAVQAAILSGLVGKIAVNVMLWSDAAFPKVNTGWHVLDSPQSADAFAALIRTFQLSADNTISFGGGGTGIGAGVETEFWFATSIMMPDAKLLAEAENVTINGLPIVSRDHPDLDAYYRERVITGPGAFVERADGFEDFGRAIRRKLLREISSTIANRELPRDMGRKGDTLRVDVSIN